jgi:two-component system, OmpR family, response regulator
MRLLVVEDDAKLLAALERGLQREGYAVDGARSGPEALERAGACDYDVVVLDVMLPGLDGFSVCQALRHYDRWVPVLMLTARGAVRDRISGLDAGADDYLVKPFDFGELLARLRALIRRGPSERPLVVTVGDLVVNPGAHLVTRGGRPVDLTAREFAVLEVLARNAGQVVSRSQLLERVWDEDYTGSTNIVDVYVGHLRRKLDRPGGRSLIRTVRGIGFVMEPR